ncbi:hypothetical protein Tco_0823648 [Tanacetum coccineum]|uniref:Uncharacterized protein n=1 Tax=Tanacetum coccineum TaxID=301880 RepID=A0ABQ5AKA4_9ASTR
MNIIKKFVSFADGSHSNTDNSRFMEKLKAMDSQLQSLKEELQDMRNKNYELRDGNASKNHMNDDTPMCERHEANYIQSEGYRNRNYHESYSPQSYHNPNDSEKSLTELNNDVRNDLEDFKRCVHSMRTIHSKLYERDGGFKKKFKPINQEPQPKTDFEKLMTKFSDSQKVTNLKEFGYPSLIPKIIDAFSLFELRSEQSRVSIPSLWMCICGFVAFSGALVLVESYMSEPHSLLVLRSPKYPKSKKNVLDEEEVLCQP